jgi:cytochrome P450
MTATQSTGRHEVDLDHHNDDFKDHNKEVIARLHNSGCPLGHSPHYGGFWAIYGYDALYDASQDWELFSSEHSAAVKKGVPTAAYDTPLLPIDVDGAAVQLYRRVLLSWFSPGGAEADRQRALEICTELIDDFIERGDCDLSQELLFALPARLVLEKLEWQPENWREWVSLVHTSLHDRNSDPDKAEQAIETIFGRLFAIMAERRANAGDDLFSHILQARPGGEPLTDDQVLGYSYLLLLGGLDTTAGLTGNVIDLLDSRADLRQQLIDEPWVLPTATEEFLRYESPSYGLYRTVTRDAIFRGQELSKGDNVMLMYPAAGLDPHQYPDPDRIDLRREGGRHMAFGLGPHRCLGSHHARMMFQVMLGQILERLPDFKIAGPIERFHDAGDVYAIRHLPIRFTPGPRIGPA